MRIPQPRTFRQQAVNAGLGLIGASGLARLVEPLSGGQGAILMFHHVRPWNQSGFGKDSGFAPNRGLEITPEFLDLAIRTVRARGYEIVSIDTALQRLDDGGRRFAVLSFDDGYRDNLVHALPVLRRLEAPFTLYVATGFAERTARLWWIELEEAIRRLDRIELTIAGQRFSVAAGTDAEKMRCFNQLYWSLRAGPEEYLLEAAAELTDAAGVDRRALVENLCMNWEEIAVFAQEPLCTIGVHTLSHPMLAKHRTERVHEELAESRARIERQIGRPAVHLAYPVGDRTSAGPREFALARDLGFKSAVTTRKGMVFAEHAVHPTALPRLSINGAFQTPGALQVLLSGAPFFLRNFGRRLDVD